MPFIARPTDKIFVKYMLIYKRNVHTKNESSILYRGRKITFPPKPDLQTDRRTDISVYRVASLLKKENHKYFGGSHSQDY